MINSLCVVIVYHWTVPFF